MKAKNCRYCEPNNIDKNGLAYCSRYATDSCVHPDYRMAKYCCHPDGDICDESWFIPDHIKEWEKKLGS